MTQEDFEALIERIDSIYDQVVNHRRCVRYMQENAKDDQTRANLSMIALGIERTENHLNRILGRPEEHSDDVPY